GEVPSLKDSVGRQFGVGRSVGVLPADGECVSHENQFHSD
ncbi:MAG: hypothetical protein RI912_1683, partial [Actinomycetota bacterium]